MVALLSIVALLTGALVMARNGQEAKLTSNPSSPSIVTLDPAIPVSNDQAKSLRSAQLRAKEAQDEAVTLLQKGQYVAAEAACRRALSLSPKINGHPADMRPQQLLGEIYIARGRNRYALSYFRSAYRYGGGIPDLDMGVALAYCRLGEVNKARHFDPEKWILTYSTFQREELPGTHTAKTLEATILFTRGLQAYLTGRNEKAVREYTAAARIVPTNGLIADCQARALRDLKRYPEAVRYFAIAATFGKGKTQQRAKNSLGAWPAADRDKALKEAAKLKPGGNA